MDDETDVMNNLCADLVCLRRFEPALVYLFRERLPGAWVPVRELYERIVPMEASFDQLAATWLPSPTGDPDYSVVLFFDDATKWSMTADYNVARLRQQHPSPAVAAAG